MLIAERRALQEQVDQGLKTAQEASFSVIVEKALLSHAARAQTPAGKAEDEKFFTDLRARWKAESPAPAPIVEPVDLRELVRQELAKAIYGELPSILQAMASEAALAKGGKKKRD